MRSKETFDVVIGLRFYETIKRENENLCFIFLVVLFLKDQLLRNMIWCSPLERGCSTLVMGTMTL